MPFFGDFDNFEVLLPGFVDLGAAFLAAGFSVVLADVLLAAGFAGVFLAAGLGVVFPAVWLFAADLGAAFVVVLVLLAAGLAGDFKGEECGILAAGLGVGLENVCGVILAIGQISFEHKLSVRLPH